MDINETRLDITEAQSSPVPTFSDLYNHPGAYVSMHSKISRAMQNGNREILEKMKNHETPMECLKNNKGNTILHLAAYFGHLKLVMSIVFECPSLLLEPNWENQLPIHVAAHAGHSDVINVLVASITFFSDKLAEENRERLNPYVLKDKYGNTPLHLALRELKYKQKKQRMIEKSGRILMYKLYIELSIPISLGNHRNGGENTEYESGLFANLRLSDCFAIPEVSVRMSPEIYSAVSAGKQTCLEMIRNYGKPMICLKSKQGDSVLHLAAASGQVELVKSLFFECPRLLMELDLSDQLPLHVASHAGHVAVVEVLVVIMTFVSAALSAEGKESLNLYVVKDVNGDTPLHIALRAIHIKAARCLVNANKQASFLPNEDGITPLYMAVEAGYVSLVKNMLKTTYNHGPDLQLTGRKCLVHAALKAKNTDLLRIILNKYSSLEDERDEKGNTCLSYGASIGFHEGVRMLLRRSTKSVYVSNDDGSFPIHIAAEKGHTYVIIVILERCPESIYLLNKDSQNMLHIVSKSGKLSFVLFSYLWVRGFMNKLMEKQDTDGNTPPHLATINWHPRTLFYLLNNHKGNCMYIRNKMGQTPPDIAESNMQCNYIYMERTTLMVLCMYTTSKTYHKSLIKRKKTTRSNAAAVDNKAQLVNTILVVAALVATVTFAGGFTIPGGFNSSRPNLGAALATDFKLICFMVFDILAMLFSILTIVTLIWGQLGDPALVQKSLDTALPSLFLALICMPVGFYCGVYIAFAHVKGFLIFLNVTSVIFVFLFLISLGPHLILHVPVIPRLCGMIFRLSVMIVGEIFRDGVPLIISSSRNITIEDLLAQLLARMWSRSFAL